MLAARYEEKELKGALLASWHQRDFEEYQTTLTPRDDLGPGALFTRARGVRTELPGESEWRDSRLAQQRERDALCMVRHERERVLRRVGRAVDAAARSFAREAAQLENSGGREAAAEHQGLWLQESTTNHHFSWYSTPPSPIR